MSILKLTACLQALEHVCPVDATEALETLSIYIENILNFPLEKKFRSIRISNAVYQDRLGHLTNCKFLEAIGFDTHGDFLKLDPSFYSFEDGDDSSSNSSEPSSSSSVLIAPPSLTVLRRMKGLVDASAQHMRQRWLEFQRSPPPSHAWHSIAAFTAADDIGRRPSMEDEYIAVDAFCGVLGQAFFGLYDGHGGRPAVEFSVRALHLNLEQELKSHPDHPISQAFETAYLKTDAQIRRQNIQTSGSTAVTCLLREDPSAPTSSSTSACYATSSSSSSSSADSASSSSPKPKSSRRLLHVANVGDSRAILCRGGQAIRLTKDHKGTDPEEAQRVTSLGGFIGRFGRVQGILAISRALGDHMLKEFVSARPYTTDTLLCPQDDFVILACDGVWDVISDQEAVDHVLNQIRVGISALSNSSLPPSDFHQQIAQLVQSLSRSLINLAMERRTTDNVTVMIVFLNDPARLVALNPACNDDVMSDKILSASAASSSPVASGSIYPHGDSDTGNHVSAHQSPAAFVPMHQTSTPIPTANANVRISASSSSSSSPMPTPSPTASNLMSLFVPPSNP